MSFYFFGLVFGFFTDCMGMYNWINIFWTFSL